MAKTKFHCNLWQIYKVVLTWFKFQIGSSIKLISNEDEAAEAVRNILGATNSEGDRKRQHCKKHHRPSFDPLRKSAEEILAGVKRPTAVEDILGVKRPATDSTLVHYLVADKQGEFHSFSKFWWHFEHHGITISFI